MKNHLQLQSLLGNTDIYLIDQILKDRYTAKDIILDAGCGGGRNLHWFLQNAIIIYGADINDAAIEQLKEHYPSVPKERFVVAPVENLPFADNYFDHIISSAVLHFAGSKKQFLEMFAEMIRVLKPNGSLFIRMTSDIGIESLVTEIQNGVFDIPDGSVRFLLTRQLLALLMKKHLLAFIEPLKTVNVDDVRCMSTLVLRKHG
ncbi:MAG: class I SAM-dependent methyltransferase [Chitinophagaceae bacterium]